MAVKGKKCIEVTVLIPPTCPDLHVCPSVTIVDGAKALANEYHAAYPKAKTFRCYRHLLVDLQKTKAGRAACDTFKEFYKMPPSVERQVEVLNATKHQCLHTD